MDRTATNTRGSYLALMALLMLFVGMAVHAQAPADGSDYAVESIDDTQLTADDLQTLVGPIALYPDDLLAIVLPASTYPLQIVQAARFLEAYEIDSTLEPDESWDESVVALINYPEVIALLNDDIDWTWRLGEAVISQQEGVVSAVEVFRDRAYAAGNLKSDEYQTVSRDNDIIEIVPIEDDIIYVPYYEPEVVVIQQPRPRVSLLRTTVPGLLLSLPVRSCIYVQLLLGRDDSVPYWLGQRSSACTPMQVTGATRITVIIITVTTIVGRVSPSTTLCMSITPGDIRSTVIATVTTGVRTGARVLVKATIPRIPVTTAMTLSVYATESLALRRAASGRLSTIRHTGQAAKVPGPVPSARAKVEAASTRRTVASPNAGKRRGKTSTRRIVQPGNSERVKRDNNRPR